MFDINALALKDTFNLHLVHPTTGDKLYASADESKPVEIVLYGTSSKQYRSAVSAMQNRQLRRQAKKEKPSAEIFREEGVNLLVACGAGANNLAVDGEPVGTPETFRKLFSDPRFSWVKDQADEALGEVGNFLTE